MLSVFLSSQWLHVWPLQMCWKWGMCEARWRGFVSVWTGLQDDCDRMWRYVVTKHRISMCDNFMFGLSGKSWPCQSLGWGGEHDGMEQLPRGLVPGFSLALPDFPPPHCWWCDIHVREILLSKAPNHLITIWINWVDGLVCLSLVLILIFCPAIIHRWNLFLDFLQIHWQLLQTAFFFFNPSLPGFYHYS